MNHSCLLNASRNARPPPALPKSAAHDPGPSDDDDEGDYFPSGRKGAHAAAKAEAAYGRPTLVPQGGSQYGTYRGRPLSAHVPAHLGTHEHVHVARTPATAALGPEDRVALRAAAAAAGAAAATMSARQGSDPKYQW